MLWSVAHLGTWEDKGCHSLRTEPHNANAQAGLFREQHLIITLGAYLHLSQPRLKRAFKCQPSHLLVTFPPNCVTPS